MGRLLFLVYINDLPNMLKKSKCVMFADDTVLYHNHMSLNELNYDVQVDLDSVYK